MNNPDIVTPQDYEFYRSAARPAEGWPPRDTPAALLRALNHAHDDLRKQEKINIAHLAHIVELRQQLRAVKIKLWVTIGALFGLWEVFKALVLHR